VCGEEVRGGGGGCLGGSKGGWEGGGGGNGTGCGGHDCGVSLVGKGDVEECGYCLDGAGVLGMVEEVALAGLVFGVPL
jgi:hypothetical protein